MAERSDSMKKAQKKYMEKFAVARVRIDRDKYEVFQSLIESRGESVSGFFNRAVDDVIASDTRAQQPPADQQPQPQQTPQQPRLDGALVLIEHGTVCTDRGAMRALYTDPNTGREYYVEPVIPDGEWEDIQKAKATVEEDTDGLPF